MSSRKKRSNLFPGVSETSALLDSTSAANDSIVKPSAKRSKNGNSNGSPKLGTFEGVFVPTALNVLSILMFLRFGFIIGQMGILGSFLMLILSYTINLLTTMSISAISTNGTVRGGGAYYMLSRSLGPEFGGAIGIIFFMGQVLNSSLNVVGFIEPFMSVFGEEGGTFELLSEGYFLNLLYCSVLLALCTGIAMVGANLVSKTALFLFIIVSISTLSAPISTLIVKPFDIPDLKVTYTGIQWSIVRENFLPRFTRGAAGSGNPLQKETFSDLFGIFFPATAGILAGASMSGDLKEPSKSIPGGTIKALLLTFMFYATVIISIGSAVSREFLHKDVDVLHTVSAFPPIITLGEVATSIFSVIMGIVGAASLLNAIADDEIIPGLSVLAVVGKSSKEQKKSQLYSIMLTWGIAQIFLLANINQIATFVTMAFLMTFIVTNLACFLLRVGSAPNFRPSFRYFNTKTAFIGVLSCTIAMFIVDGMSATLVLCFLLFLIMIIHYSTPSSKFGDISQLLIYHQVRKYLLRLKYNMSVKYWRPQILLLCDNPRTSWNLIGFCNHLKKGGLYILGHVVITNDERNKADSNAPSDDFDISIYKEIQKQRRAWTQLRNMSKIKAFVQIALGPTLPWGVRNVYLGSGLGGMRPNITVLGFYDMHRHGMADTILPSIGDRKQFTELPTDDCRTERKISVNQWVQIVEDLIIMQATVAVAANFIGLNLPTTRRRHFWSSDKINESSQKHYIDLYPIQMSSINILEDGQSVLSTNFDTYTLILQLGSILSTVPEWKLSNSVLRVIAFVECEDEVEEEKARLNKLLTKLRIVAETKVISLDNGSLGSYNFIVKGYNRTPTNQREFDRLDFLLKDDQWWKNLRQARDTLKEIGKQKETKRNQRKGINVKSFKDALFSPLNLSPPIRNDDQAHSQQKNSLKDRRRYTLSNLHENGLSLPLNMKSLHIGKHFSNSRAFDTSSDSSESDDDFRDDNLESGSLVDCGSFTNKQEGFGESVRRNLNEFAFKYKNKVHNIDVQSISSSKSNLRPNFSSFKIPDSEVNEGGYYGDSNGDEPTKSSIRFVTEGNSDERTHADISEHDYKEHEYKEQNDSGNEAKETDNECESSKLSIGDMERMKNSDANSKNQKARSSTEHPKAQKKDSQSTRGGEKAHHSSLISNTGEIVDHMNSPSFLVEDEEGEGSDNEQENEESAYEGIGKDKKEKTSRCKATKDSSSHKLDSNGRPLITRKQLQEELRNLSFNDIPAKGQHMILNELIKLNSPMHQTSVIFSTLPAPSIGTHLHDNESLEYCRSLAIWLDDLPPVMLINSQTVTVTTDL